MLASSGEVSPGGFNRVETPLGFMRYTLPSGPVVIAKPARDCSGFAISCKKFPGGEKRNFFVWLSRKMPPSCPAVARHTVTEGSGDAVLAAIQVALGSSGSILSRKAPLVPFPPNT